MAKNKRREKREPCYGKLIFLTRDVPAYIRDISEQGMRIDVPRPFEPCVNPQDSCTVKILPEGDAVFEPFMAEIEIRWIRTDPLFTSIGAKLNNLEKGKKGAYEALLSLYRSHSSADG
jgi:hypothetical protein